MDLGLHFFSIEIIKKRVGNALATRRQHIGNALAMRWQRVGNALTHVGNALTTHLQHIEIYCHVLAMR